MSTLILLAILGVAGCSRRPVDVGEAIDRRIDLSNDFHHRIDAGLFVPTCEPVLVRLWTNVGGKETPVPGAVLDVDLPLGRLGVEADAGGQVVMHFDQEAMSSHVRISELTGRCGVGRAFLEYPVHPLR